MSYFKSKLKAIGREYIRRDRDTVISAAGGKCTMCGRKAGDYFTFGPTNYLKQQIKFKVNIDIHVIDGSGMGRQLIVICSGCHLSYHLFNRLSENADMGGKRLSDTLYKRCTKCRELNCMCCKGCGNLPKWCICGNRKTKVIKGRMKKKCHVGNQKIKRLKLRAGKKNTKRTERL